MLPRSRPSRRPLRGVVALALLAHSACARYVAVEPGASPAGAEVRVVVADAARDELVRVLGPRTAQLEGRLMRADDASLTIAVASIRRTSGLIERWDGDSVTVPRAAIADVSRREVSAVRSGVPAAGLVALGIVIGCMFTDEADVGGGGRPGPAPPR